MSCAASSERIQSVYNSQAEDGVILAGNMNIVTLEDTATRHHHRRHKGLVSQKQTEYIGL